MKAGIITVGDEILIGQITDTNSAFIANRLAAMGIETIEMATVSDSEADITETVDRLWKKTDVLLLTGGLGPTNDDITKKTLCRYFDTELVFSNSVLENIQALRPSESINELTRSQAMVPAAATVIQNRVGTAPVMLFERGDKLLISLPGVPYEMQYAMQHEIEPMLAARCKKEHYCCQNFIVAHFTESALAQYLNDFESKLPAGFGLAYLPTPGFVKLRLFFRDADSDLQFRQMTDKLKTVLRNHLLASEDISMPEILGKLLLEKKASIATAESCTGGAVAAAITQVAGASQYFKGSIIAYSNRVKNRLLSVPLEIIEKHGAVSPATAELMAKGAMTALQTDCSIAITGIAGPEGGTAYKPVGTVWISTRYKTSSQTKLYHCMGKLRSANIVRATNYALIQMIDMLLEKQSD